MRQSRRALFGFLAVVLAAPPAAAIPAFARRYALSCHTCHEFHYPRLNSFGNRFRLNGYQLPDGAEDQARAQRTIEPGTIAENLTIFKEPPLSVRGEVFGEVTRDDNEPITYANRISSMLSGGGSVARDVFFFFSWTPFPTPMFHHANIGIANIGKSVVGEGSLNVRAGLLLLLDAQRPAHRALAPWEGAAGSVRVGQTPFALDDSSLGVRLEGRPHYGPLSYDLAVVAGPPGVGADPDRWKDLFGRLSYIWFQNTSHEVKTGAFGYYGHAERVTNVGGVELAQSDRFWLGGIDLEVDAGPFDISGMAYTSHHSDPSAHGAPVDFVAARAEAIWGVTPKVVGAVRIEWADSGEDSSLRRAELAPHLTYLFAPNVLGTIVWRQDLMGEHKLTVTSLLETAF